MPIVWHPKRWWNFCMSKNEKKEIELILLSNAFNASIVYNIEILKYFSTKT